MRKLYIENFGPVKQADLELRDVNLFIGEQSVGKSTIAKLITILTDYISLTKVVMGGYGIWIEQLKAYNIDAYADDSYNIVYQLEEKKLVLRLEIWPKELKYTLTKNGRKLVRKKTISSELISLRGDTVKESFLRDLKEEVQKWEATNFIENFLNIMSNSLYIPAERIIYSVVSNLMPAFALVKSAIPSNLLRFLVDLTNAKAKYPHYDIPMLGISYQRKNSDDFILVADSHKELPLSSASSGIQSTLPLLLILQFAINNRDYSSYVIEEPECNLFPEKQVDLLRLILRSLKTNHSTLTITTHSPYLLSAMNNYLFAGTLVEKYKDNIKDSVEQVLPAAYHLKPGECSVYSLGEAINGDGIYCKNLIDEQTGMIDYNSLDTISATLSEEFEALENTYIQMIHK